MQAKVTLIRPYLATVSVNHAYNRNNPRCGTRPEVDAWLWEMRAALGEAINAKKYKLPAPRTTVQVDISIFAPMKRGRLPDTGNFRKLIEDVVAARLGVDDQGFGGVNYPAIRTEPDNMPRIVIEVSWIYNNGNQVMRDDSALAHGPISKDMKRRLGLRHVTELCIGFGSAYCWQVCTQDASLDCPQTFNPGVYAEDGCPCATCEFECPCLTNPPEREEAILKWWRARVKSTKFERKHWE